MTDRSERVSLTVPTELIEELDDVVEAWEYASRSKAVRNALRAFLADHRWQRAPDRRHRGSITIVYDHHAPGVTDALLDVQHDHAEVTVATQHVHFDADRCLETIVVEGTGEELRELIAGIKSIGGVEQVRFTVV